MKSHYYLQSAPEQIMHDMVTKNECTVFYKCSPGLLTQDELLPSDDLVEMQNLVRTTEIYSSEW